ncbi:MAG: glycosyltransferase [Bacteroidales bacterium]|nr:glycosyltransferase [Bacteroidales bacterium]
MIKIISFVSNDIVTDNRVHKISSTLVYNGYDVTVVGRKFSDKQDDIINRNYKTHRFRLMFNKGPLFYLNLNLRIIQYLIRNKTNIVVSNDLDTLPGCFIGSSIRRRTLVFDSHELFPEVPELVHRPKIRGIWKFLERYFVPKVKHGLTVCQSIADYYQDKYNSEFEVVRNVGNFKFDDEFEGIHKSEEITVLYQGALNYGRGIELAIESIRFSDNVKLWILGSGDIENRLKSMVKKHDLEDRVEFFGRIPLEDLWNYTPRAHIGISIEENLGLNYRYALPNKLFDYIQARIPVIVSDLPEMESIIKKYKIGKVLKERTPEALNSLIMELIENELKNESYFTNLEFAARELCWEREEHKVIKLFNDVNRKVLV